MCPEIRPRVDSHPDVIFPYQEASNDSNLFDPF